ncbi:lysophospholipid acyltransferase family protein [Micromonospora sp. NPDC007271]|uniref:lysophospholipid acyltransferase family protein n=1 Tax=Micromonospora sp. NPDC007271 TaxID=3154587 RepID=UPI0033FEF646
MGLIREFKNLRGRRDWRGRSTTPRSAEPYELAPEPTQFPTAWARTRAARVVRFGLQRGVLKSVAWTQTRPVVRGTEYLDGVPGPVIFVANHASHLDAPLILGSVPRRFAHRVAVGAAADYFFDARWRAVVTSLVFNAFPIERHSDRRQRSLAPTLLGEGWSLLLFPESSRSQDGWMSGMRLGAAHLCCSRNIPAVPIALRGTFAAMPRGRNWPMPGRPGVVVRYGRPLWPAEGESPRDFHQRIVTAVARLWSEEELGWYRSLRLTPRAATTRTVGPQGASWRRVWAATRELPVTDSRPTRRVWPAGPR